MILPEVQPLVGMGVTIQHWSDRGVGTIIQISHSDKRLVIQEDKTIRTDKNGMSEFQSYSYQRDPNGQIHIATLRKDGRYRISKTKRLVSLDVRNAYHDFSF